MELTFREPPTVIFLGLIVAKPRVVLQFEEHPIIEVVEDQGVFRMAISCGTSNGKRLPFVPIAREKLFELDEIGGFIRFLRVDARTVNIIDGRLRTPTGSYIVCSSEGAIYLSSTKYQKGFTKREENQDYKEIATDYHVLGGQLENLQLLSASSKTVELNLPQREEA